jgi:hypothetical protein
MVFTVMFAVTIVIGPCPVADAGPQVASAGRPLQVKLTAVKPVEATMPTVVVPDKPGLVMVTFVGPETRAKPGWIVKVTDAVLLLEWKLASPA